MNNEETQSLSLIEQLPSEMLIIIFTFLDDKEIFSNLSKVCHEFNRITNDDILYQLLCKNWPNCNMFELENEFKILQFWKIVYYQVLLPNFHWDEDFKKYHKLIYIEENNENGKKGKIVTRLKGFGVNPSCRTKEPFFKSGQCFICKIGGFKNWLMIGVSYKNCRIIDDLLGENERSFGLYCNKTGKLYFKYDDKKFKNVYIKDCDYINIGDIIKLCFMYNINSNSGRKENFQIKFTHYKYSTKREKKCFSDIALFSIVCKNDIPELYPTVSLGVHTKWEILSYVKEINEEKK